MSQATLQRRPLVKKILAGADDNLLVIAGLGSPNWDITEAGDRPLNMPLWGGMGAPVPMGRLHVTAYSARLRRSSRHWLG